MKMQFFHVEDLCRFIEVLLEKKPENRIFNVGNPETVTINDWVKLCYDVVGKTLISTHVYGHPQRGFFCFHDYDYCLDVSKQSMLMPSTKPLDEGLRESYAWYQAHRGEIVRKNYTNYIDEKICK